MPATHLGEPLFILCMSTTTGNPSGQQPAAQGPNSALLRELQDLTVAAPTEGNTITPGVPPVQNEGRTFAQIAVTTAPSISTVRGTPTTRNPNLGAPGKNIPEQTINQTQT